MNQPRALKELELDALKEVANIGAGHAATALSQLTNRRVMIDVPRVQVSSLEDAVSDIGGEGDVIAAVLMQILGDVTGRTLVIFERACALRLVDTLLGRAAGTTEDFTELEQSTLKETANILTGAYLGGLADMLGMILIPSIPSLAVDLSAAILSTAYLSFGRDPGAVIVLDTRFRFEPGDVRVSGHFVLLPDPSNLEIVLKALRFGD